MHFPQYTRNEWPSRIMPLFYLYEHKRKLLKLDDFLFRHTSCAKYLVCDWCDKINYLRQDTRLCTAPFSTFKSFDQKSSLKVGKKCVHFAILKRILRINCLAKNSLLRNMNRGKKIKQNNVVECSYCVAIQRNALTYVKDYFSLDQLHIKKGFKMSYGQLLVFKTQRFAISDVSFELKLSTSTCQKHR